MTDSEKVYAVKTLLGWTPPLVYDIASDQHRLATQADMDKYARLMRLQGQISAYLAQIRGAIDQAKVDLADIDADYKEGKSA